MIEFETPVPDIWVIPGEGQVQAKPTSLELTSIEFLRTEDCLDHIQLLSNAGVILAVVHERTDMDRTIVSAPCTQEQARFAAGLFQVHGIAHKTVGENGDLISHCNAQW